MSEYDSCVVRTTATYTGDTGDGFAAGQIGDVDEGVVEGSENAGNAENELALYNTVSIRPWCSNV
jgi:hypothetical protein